MSGPTLWILGDRDQSVPVFATVMVLESLQPDVAARHTVVRFPNAGHDLRDVTSGESAPIWDAMREWMSKVGVTHAVAK
jgi:pimeloyl-ACP methyl ester carboxylesterase